MVAEFFDVDGRTDRRMTKLTVVLRNFANVPKYGCLAIFYVARDVPTLSLTYNNNNLIISFMQGIYTYITETNYVPREYSVAAVLLLLFMVLISLVPVLNLLYFYISTFRSVCAVRNMPVFCSSLTYVFLVCCSRIF